ncbi:Transcription factor 21 [Halotydeus destructor]|nr:Transcription factor 21 [Halotydeus destructor]
MARNDKFFPDDWMSSQDSDCPESQSQFPKRKPVARNAANARERGRMRVLSKAFSRLKTCLPWVPPDTKLSKLDTLRLATSYIAHLREVLADESPPSCKHPSTLSWPYSGSNQQMRPLFTNSVQNGDSSYETSESYSPDQERTEITANFFNDVNRFLSNYDVY